MVTSTIEPRWRGEGCIVVAPGPSLTGETVHRVRMARWFDKWRVIAVNDAYRLMPHADVLYAADMHWWRVHEGAKDFHGERWSCHSLSPSFCDDKSQVYQEFDLRLVEAADGKGFSGASRIHYGSQPHSGFQAVNLALLFGADRVVLVGFDMRHVSGRAHYFGEHPDGMFKASDADYRDMTKAYPPDARIVNATPGSALKAYPIMELDEALRRDDSVHRHGAVAHA